MKGKIDFKFPKGFLWGAATSAYQVEGGNKNSDWESWLKSKKKTPAGKACDQYNLYESDFTLVQQLSHNAHRLSIEWARIEPEKGNFSKKGIAHYKKVLSSLKSKGIKTIVTLHHFTNPKWFTDSGGWEAKNAGNLFARYAKHIAKNLDEHIDYYLTFNEPEIYTFNGWVVGKWIPEKSSLKDAYKVYRNLSKAHKLAYRRIKSISNTPIGIAKNNSLFEPCPPIKPLDHIAVWLNKKLVNDVFISWTKKHLDFIGLNYYFHNLLQFDLHIKHVICASVENVNLIQNDLGWEIYPEGIYKVLKQLKKWRKPIMITENGLADSKDSKRERFILDHLYYIHKAIKEGVDVKGYLHWSLIDNFEWLEGFKPRFGLIKIDYKTQKRTIRESALSYANVIKDNGFSKAAHKRAKYR